MRNSWIAGAALIALALAAGCRSDAPPEPHTGNSAVTGATTKARPKAPTQERTVDAMETELQGLEARMERLRVQAADAGTRAKEEFERLRPEMDKALARIRTDLNKARAGGENIWDNIRSSLANALDDASAALRRAESNIAPQPEPAPAPQPKP